MLVLVSNPILRGRWTFPNSRKTRQAIAFWIVKLSATANARYDALTEGERRHTTHTRLIPTVQLMYEVYLASNLNEKINFVNVNHDSQVVQLTGLQDGAGDETPLWTRPKALNAFSPCRLFRRERERHEFR